MSFVTLISCKKSEKDSNNVFYIETGEFPEVDAGVVLGDIVIAGSSTVYPLAEKLADMFREEGYSGNIEISSIGSGAGFERWATQGETDIVNASRPIRKNEVEAARSINRDPIEFKIGVDALAIVVHKDNTWVEDISLEELTQVFTAEKWSDVNPNWPNEIILKFSPGTDSGTFDYFIEEVFDKNRETLLSVNNLQLSENDNILSRGIQGSKNAIGYFGYAYYEEQSDMLNILKINGIEANKKNIDEGNYPLMRPLFMYSAETIMNEKPQIAAFLAYVLNVVNSVVRDVGYFAVSEEVIEEAKQKWSETVKR